LILSAIHVPLPQADYHNIRHHDAPGEICPYHDHLLRWHPSATSDADVSLLHWHWFLPLVQPGAQLPDSDSDRPGRGLALHAHVGDWPEPDWTGGPAVRPDDRGRLVEQLTLRFPGACSVPFWPELADPRAGARAFGAAPPDAAPARAERSALNQRWNC
jgi:hypothetical protein